jgi:hypothetical protein
MVPPPIKRSETRMRALLPALAFIAFVSVSVLVQGLPAAPDAASRDGASYRIASVMCGSGGCTMVQTKQAKHRKFQTMGHG